MEKIKQLLFELQDKEYGEFQAKLIPEKDPESIIGVRTPEMRALAKKLKKDPEIGAFLDELPHEYFDEYQLHAFLLSEEKSFDECIRRVEEFLPYIDNWATCDQLSPKVFKKHTEELLPYIEKWMGSSETYTVRFGIGMLLRFYLDEYFDPAYPEMVSEIRSPEYYIKMMVAWYFATALAKQYEIVIPYIENERLDIWTHNKAIQKSVESYRITPEQKEYLKSLRINLRKHVKEQTERIAYYEEILDEAIAFLEKGVSSEDSIDSQEKDNSRLRIKAGPELEAKLHKLDSYYGSDEWRSDMSSDAAGLLPEDFKRGVLSEDGIYNVLTELLWDDK